MTPPIPPNEKKRLRVLWQYDLLDTVPEEIFDDLTELAARICEAPIAMITLVDEDRQWFKSKVGVSINETSRDVSFCGHAIGHTDLFIALLPVTALPLLLGGVTGGEFARMSLALANTLFISLAAGLCVSSLSRDSQRAMGGTLLLMAFLAGALPALGGVSWAGASLAWFSPFLPFRLATDVFFSSQSGKFWSTLALSHATGWLFLAVTAGAVTSFWQDKELFSKVEGWQRWLRLNGLVPVNSAAARSRMLPMSPIFWLINRERSLRWLAWLIVIGWGIAILFTLPSPSSGLWGSYSKLKGCAFVLKLLVAVQACRFFTEARRNGSLELLLSTPLRNRDIIHGQWLALREIFAWPFAVFIGVSLLPMIFSIWVNAGSNPGARFGGALMEVTQSMVLLGWFTVTLIADFIALGWFGMWLALSMKNPKLAPAFTIFWVLLLFSWPFCPLDILADLFFISWGSSRLKQDFRWVLAKQQASMSARQASFR